MGIISSQKIFSINYNLIYNINEGSSPTDVEPDSCCLNQYISERSVNRWRVSSSFQSGHIIFVSSTAEQPARNKRWVVQRPASGGLAAGYPAHNKEWAAGRPACGIPTAGKSTRDKELAIKIIVGVESACIRPPTKRVTSRDLSSGRTVAIKVTRRYEALTCSTLVQSARRGLSGTDIASSNSALGELAVRRPSSGDTAFAS